MLIDGVTNAGAMPALEMAMTFAARRQELIAHNISNLTTPNFQATDVDPRGFQRMLAEAVDGRRRANGGTMGELDWSQTRQIRRGPRGTMSFKPHTVERGVLFQDRNNRDLERTMQDLAENSAYFRVAADLMRSQTNQLKAAIAERV